MQVCWNCKAQQLDGSIFCSECGASLIQKDERRGKTRTSLDEPPRSGTFGDVEDINRTPPPPPAPPTSTTGSGFSLVFLETQTRLPLEENRELTIGRADEKRGIVPDIDLGNHGGYEAGVSRRHAVLSLYHRNCVLKDLGSANGTYINNRRVPPNQPTLINHGDEVRFGTLQARVEFGS